MSDSPLVIDDRQLSECCPSIYLRYQKFMCSRQTAGSWEWKRFKRTEQQMRLVKKGPKDDKLDRRSLHNTLHSLRDTTVEVVTVKDSCLSNMVTTAVPD